MKSHANCVAFFLPRRPPFFPSRCVFLSTPFKKKKCFFLSSFSLFPRTHLLGHVFTAKTVVATLSRSSLQDVLSHWLSLSYYLLFKGALSLTVFLFKAIAAATSPRLASSFYFLFYFFLFFSYDLRNSWPWRKFILVYPVCLLVCFILHWRRMRLYLVEALALLF